MSSSSSHTPKPTAQHTHQNNAGAVATLPMSDRRDFDDVARGFLATLQDPVTYRSPKHSSRCSTGSPAVT